MMNQKTILSKIILFSTFFILSGCSTDSEEILEIASTDKFIIEAFADSIESANHESLDRLFCQVEFVEGFMFFLEDLGVDLRSTLAQGVLESKIISYDKVNNVRNYVVKGEKDQILPFSIHGDGDSCVKLPE